MFVIVEVGVVSDLEFPSRIIELLPRMRQTGYHVVVAIEVHQLGENILIHLHRRIELGKGRIHIDWLVDGGGGEGTASRWRTLRKRSCQAETWHHGLRYRDAADGRHRLQKLPSRDASFIVLLNEVMNLLFLQTHL